jgi:hypothetical protein
MRAAIITVAALAVSAGADRGNGIVMPQVSRAIQIDGELDEVAWRSPARTGPFVDAHGAQAAPYSEARFLRDDNFVYLALYAADEDIRSTDEFVVELSSSRGQLTMHFTPKGTLAPAVAGARVAVDLDGTIDAAADDDEEWVIESAIPLAAVPFGRDGTVAAKVSRCDTTKDRVRRCGAWQGRLVRR